jgi:hypothetical protein
MENNSMTYAEKARALAAALRARRLYPGIVGEVLSSELRTWAEFGFRFGPGRTIALMQELEREQPPRITLATARVVDALHAPGFTDGPTRPNPCTGQTGVPLRATVPHTADRAALLVAWNAMQADRQDTTG